MRIAHVANFYGPTSGGLKTAMHALGRGYLAAGHEYLMVVPGESDTDEVTEFGRRVTIHSPVLPLSGGYRVISRTSEVKAILTGFSPDVLEVSDRTTLRGLGTWAAKRSIPSAFFAHERADGIMYANLWAWLAKMTPIKTMADAHNRAMDRRFATVIATTAFAAAEFDRIGVPVTRVPLGVDLHAFHPQHFNKSVREGWVGPEDHLLMMASRLSPEKRPDIAIDAVRLLAGSGRKVRLISAGSGVLDAQMRDYARGAPVTFVGYVSGREKFAAMLASADCVVAPGPIETFGLAALEGLASGTPAVVNAASALPEVIGEAGVASAGSAEAFAEAIATVLDWDPVERRERARAQAEKFPWEATVATMLAIHQGALAA